MRLSVALLLTAISTVSGSVTIKSLVFPTETSTSYVSMVPKKPMNMTAFTLCMRVATELSGQREVILFAYRTSSRDELNMWREMDGRLSFYMGTDGVLFKVPELGALLTHLCFTWDSSSGASTVFMNGKKSLTKIFKKGHTVQPGGNVHIGQDSDDSGEFYVKQCFVGEICDINMWDSVLSESSIQALSSGTSLPPGNIFDWKTTELQVHGDVHVVPREL